MRLLLLYTLLLSLGTAAMAATTSSRLSRRRPLPPATAGVDCNGHVELCNRMYSNVSFIGAHDSAFIGTQHADNQKNSVTDQLNAGIRFLQAQVHKKPIKKLEMCHTSCAELDAGSLESYLTTIEDWMSGNVNDVVTLLLTNPDSQDVSMFDTAFANSGLKDFVFTPQTPANQVMPLDGWPTLGEMTANNSRLVVFLDKGADIGRVNYIIDEWDYFFETAFDVTDSNSFASCDLVRPANGSPANRMIIVNHFLDTSLGGGGRILIPDVGSDDETNAAVSWTGINVQSKACANQYGHWPNFVLLDNVETGDWLTAQNTMNGL